MFLVLSNPKTTSMKNGKASTAKPETRQKEGHVLVKKLDRKPKKYFNNPFSNYLEISQIFQNVGKHGENVHWSSP